MSTSTDTMPLLTAALADILRTEAIEEAFSCDLVHRPNSDADKLHLWLTELQNALKQPTAAEPLSEIVQTAAIRQILNVAAGCSYSRLQTLMELVERLVRGGTLPARLTCETVMGYERLVWTAQDFWFECFGLVRRLVDLVEYKGVREIMKSCCERARSLPQQQHRSSTQYSLQPQIHCLVALTSRIMDRDASLLPAYLLVNELQKAFPEDSWPHWTLASAFSDYVAAFRRCAQMVSVVGLAHMRPVVEHSGCPEHMVNPWRLDAITLRFTLKGTLPYSPTLLAKQTGLLRYVLEQPYSRDLVCGMLGLQKQHKQHCAALEEQLVALVVHAMERSEAEGEERTQGLWLHLSSQLIYFVLFQFASFRNIVLALHVRLQGRDLKRGRNQLMWVLLQFISGSIQRNPLSNFLPVLKLYELLFPDDEPPLTVPDFNQPQCTRQMAMTCIWIHLTKKAQSEGQPAWTVPNRLRAHHEFLQHLVPPVSMGNDYRIALLCNAYSTNQDYFSKPMAALVETIQGSSTPKVGSTGGSGGTGADKGQGQTPTAPLSMAVLDSLTVHSKMSLIHSIVSHVIKLAQNKSLAPALVETYSRLLVYTEIESLGIKGFISQLLPAVYKSHAWHTLYTLLEMFSYRMHHIHPHYRVQLLSHLHSLAAVPQANQTQLHLCVESTALRLITGLGSAEVQPELSRFLSEPKTLVSAESEELNRALVLTLARATHITGADGAWCTDLLATISQNTPHAWAPHTLECFPRALAEFFQQHPVPKENKQQLKKAVEEEYRKWASMNNENDILAHFGVAGSSPLFLCLLWKMLLETDQISPIAYKILERIGARALSAHLRKFCDCLVFEFSNSPGGPHVNKCVDTINDMIWKYNIVTIDRLVLCLALRTQEGSEAQVCSFIIQLILLKATEFRNRVQDFVKDNSPDHWRQTGWHERHLDFHRKYPEKFAPEEQTGGGYHPYFGNVCLRFLPVFDIVVHRFLEIPQVTKSLEILLEHLGCLYKFHDRPVTYLYNTLHYYEARLHDRPPLKRKLVAAVLGSLKDTLSEPYQLYLTRDEVWIPELDYYVQLVRRVVTVLDGECPTQTNAHSSTSSSGTSPPHHPTPTTTPTPSSATPTPSTTPTPTGSATPTNSGGTCDSTIVGDQANKGSATAGANTSATSSADGSSVTADHQQSNGSGIGGNGTETDWRFNEFPNAGAQVLYSSCVELMALSVGPQAVANGLLNVVLHAYTAIPPNHIHRWCNAIGLLLAALPASYWTVLHERLLEIIASLDTATTSAANSNGAVTAAPATTTTVSFNQQQQLDIDIFRLLDFDLVHKGHLHNKLAYALALAHAVWHHAGPGHIASVPRWVRERLPAIVRTEDQFIIICHLLGPFLSRFNVAIMELTLALYELLAQVDRNEPQLRYMDPICDLLYHIKYMFVGDTIKKELEAIVRQLKPALQLRLRFIAHLTVEEVNDNRVTLN